MWTGDLTDTSHSDEYLAATFISTYFSTPDLNAFNNSNVAAYELRQQRLCQPTQSQISDHLNI